MNSSIFYKILLLLLFFLFPASVMAAIDLQITPPNITFSSSTPIEGEDIFINATFSNAGNQNASNVLVRFFDDSIPIGNITADVPAFSSTSVTQFWKAEIGPNTIKAILDPNNVIPETNENNNNVSKEISIAAYHTYFGKSLAITALGIGVDSLFKKEAAGCNVLVVDSDSNVDFSSLQAIGRRENGIPTLNDFIDVDTVLNMTAFNDSIASVWTLYGNFPNFPIFKAIPKKVETFTVFGQTIANVSIINSTNTTTFRTGILWDTSDNTPVFNRQFDATDREDLVFITKINQSKQGKFGVYDYEIKVPALLRDYKPGSSTIDFFLDMDSICS